MIYIVICIAAFLVSGLPLFSGFGLGTLLMPAFALFFPVHVVVAATAVVHGANNIFKIFVVGRNADRDLVLRFGIPAIMAAFVGALLFGYVSGFGELFRYSIGLKTAVVTPIKLVMGILMFVFAKETSWIGLEQLPLIIAGIMAAFAGAMIGKRWMHKVTMNAIQWLTGFLLLAIALALGAGII